MNIAVNEPQSTTIEKEVNIKVCDAIMGSGKTSAAINYMNAHPRERFIYVSPRLSEDTRIMNACPALRFELPVEDKKRGRKKTGDLKRLLYNRRNVAISHRLFSLCDDEIGEIVRQNGYILIIDEVVNVLFEAKTNMSNLRIIERTGALRRYDDGRVEISGDIEADMRKSAFSDLVIHAASHRLVSDSKENLLFWMVSDRMLRACKQVIIMTYMFERSPMCAYLKMHHLSYEPLYVAHPADGEYYFSDHMSYMPEYTGRVSQLIHVCDNPKLNAIGEVRTHLSHNWYHEQKRLYERHMEQKRANGANAKKKREEMDPFRRVRANMYSFFEYRNDANLKHDCLWACYSDMQDGMTRNGYKTNFLVFNATSMNNFGDRHYLAYPVNVYQKISIRRYFKEHEIDIEDNDYALSCMIQWIWRSAIRNGEEVWLYLPSSRMRRLLNQWMKRVEQDYAQYQESLLKEDVSNG